MDRSFEDVTKLNDGIEYSEKEIDEMTWLEKTKLVQKGVQGTSIIGYKSFLTQFLKVILNQLEKSKIISTELSFNNVAPLISICLFG